MQKKITIPGNSKLACCFKTEMHNYSFDTRKKICMKRRRSTKILPRLARKFKPAVRRSRGNVKLKLPNEYKMVFTE